VYRYARALVRGDADAEDVLQQTFVSAWKGAAQARAVTSARPWLFTIARHAAYRLGRRHVGEPRVDDVESVEELGERAGFACDDSPELLVMALEERATLQRALSSLAPDDREIVTLRDVEGLSGPEAASVLGITLDAEKSRIHRARLRLAAALRGAA
jgi:RNA polymerase sigma-70 factor (ECF subfamily)